MLKKFIAQRFNKRRPDLDRLFHFYLILMAKNYPFYIVLHYIMTFMNANRILNEDLLQTLHKELNCEHSQDLSTIYRNFVTSYLHCHVFSRLPQF